MANLDTFTAEERELISGLDLARLPRHIAVIMDGNGRWATRQGLPRVLGHRAGVESVRRTLRTSLDLGIECVTLYSFSTENWSRPDDEVQALMGLIEHQMREEMGGLHEMGVRILHLGRTAGLPDSLQGTLREAEEMTRENTSLVVQFAINYSGRAELLDAASRLARAAMNGTVDPLTMSESDFAGALYHPEIPDPDLLIRTAGEQRVSNYLLWQIAYTEFYFTEILWPDFGVKQLLEALLEYQRRQRKYGGISS